MSVGDRLARAGLPNLPGMTACPPPRGRPPDSDTTRVHPLRVPCRTCRRGSIAIFETGASARGRRVACPACGGSGFV
jgi:hypothetical protein